MSKERKKELKRLLKLEIKKELQEFGPLSTVQGIANGLINMVAAKKKNITKWDYDRKIAAAKKKSKEATRDLIAFAKVLEKKYGSWEKIPKSMRKNIQMKVPNIYDELKNFDI